MASTQAASSARQAARAALHKARPSPTAALAKPVKRHEKLAKTLEWLTKEPKPILEKVTSLELTYAYRNDHFGARHFAKEELPRIAYNNPSIRIHVDRRLMKPEEAWKPIMKVSLGDENTKELDMEKKSSFHILEELLAVDRRAPASPPSSKKPSKVSAESPIPETSTTPASS